MGATTIAALALVAGPSGDAALFLKARELVSQLAAPVFRDRENASRELVRMGYRARVALAEGESHPDPEVADRCRRLLPQAIEWHIQRLLEGFLADSNGPWPEDLPGARRWVQIVGSTKESRELFAEMVQNHRQILAQVEQAPRQLPEIYKTFCQEVYARYRSNIEDRFRYSGVSRSELVLFLFLGSDPVQKRSDAGPRAFMAAYQFLNQTSLSQALSELGGSDPIKKLFVAWLAKEQQPNVLRRAFMLASQAGLKEAVPTGIKLVRDKTLPPSSRAQVMIYLARMGDRNLIKEVEPFLDDKSLITTVRFNDEQMTVELRDVAMGACILLAKEKPADFGFERIRSEPGSFSTYMYYGFTTDEKREAAHKKWKEWWAQQQKK
jgi:hypothetical protein